MLQKLMKCCDSVNQKSSLESGNLIIYTVFFALSAFFISSTFFMPGANIDPIHDSGIFAYIGWAVGKGQTLYTEAWENKGPLLYFINLFGVLLNKRFGLAIIEFVFMFASMIFSYKTARLFAGKAVAVIAVIYSFSLLSATLEGGNLCEEYAILFTVIGLYFSAKFIKNGFEINKGYFLIIGMCGGALVVLRLNLLAFFAAIAVVLLLVLIKQRKFKVLACLCLFSLVGFVLFLTPFAVYLIRTGSFKACLDAAYLMGDTFADKTVLKIIHNVLHMFYETTLSSFSVVFIAGFFIVTTTLLALRKVKSKEHVVWILITDVAFVFNTLANSISGAYHPHYFMSFVPIFIIPSAIVFDEIYKHMKKRLKHLCIRNCIAGLAAVVLFAPFVCIQAFNIYKNFHVLTVLNVAGVSEYVTQHSSPDDTIQLIGAENGYIAVYYLSERLSASKYSYYQDYNFTDEKITGFANDIADDIMRQKPKIILVPRQEVLKGFIEHQHDSEFSKYFNENYAIDYTDSNGLSFYLLNP